MTNSYDHHDDDDDDGIGIAVVRFDRTLTPIGNLRELVDQLLDHDAVIITDHHTILRLYEAVVDLAVGARRLVAENAGMADTIVNTWRDRLTTITNIDDIHQWT